MEERGLAAEVSQHWKIVTDLPSMHEATLAVPAMAVLAVPATRCIEAVLAKSPPCAFAIRKKKKEVVLAVPAMAVLAVPAIRRAVASEVEAMVMANIIDLLTGGSSIPSGQTRSVHSVQVAAR